MTQTGTTFEQVQLRSKTTFTNDRLCSCQPQLSIAMFIGSCLQQAVIKPDCDAQTVLLKLSK